MVSDAYKLRIAGLREQIEVALSRSVADRSWPSSLQSAVEYSLLAGGKRLRPVLVLLANELCGGNPGSALPAACAIEMVHTYSLIHDDLPAMDNDDYRRGRLTNHKVYGEALAILAGDALLTLSFEMLSQAEVSAGIRAELMRILAVAAGGGGMVGGQVLDLEAERGGGLSPGGQNSGTAIDKSGSAGAVANGAKTGCGVAEVADSGQLPEWMAGVANGQTIPGNSEIAAVVSSRKVGASVEDLNRIHRMKTGALIAASLEMGAVTAGAGWEQRAELVRYGHCIGLAFQIADDVLDVTGDAAKLGKTPGRDVDLGKLTYPALLGLESSRERAKELVREACGALKCFGEQRHWLEELAGFIVERDH